MPGNALLTLNSGTARADPKKWRRSMTCVKPCDAALRRATYQTSEAASQLPGATLAVKSRLPANLRLEVRVPFLQGKFPQDGFRTFQPAAFAIVSTRHRLIPRFLFPSPTPGPSPSG